MKRKANTTFGSAWLHRLLVSTLRHVDVRLTYVFAALFVVPVCLVANASRRTSWHYMRRRMGYGRVRAAWGVYLNHCMFAQAVIDRFAMFAGRRFSISVEGYSHYSRLASRPEAFLVLSAHVGCYEVAGYSLAARDKRFNALVYGGEKETVMQCRRRQLAGNNIRMIPVTGDMSHLFPVNNALADGEIVSMPADRAVGSAKTVTATFLGAEAQFPQGPFAVAAMRGLDVLAVNVMKTSATGYTVSVAPLHYDRAAPRREQQRQIAAAYADELGRVLRKHPSQWYNFYEFWP